MSQKRSHVGTLRVPNRGRWLLEDDEKRTIELHTLIDGVLAAANGKFAGCTRPEGGIAFRFQDSQGMGASQRYDHSSGWLLEAESPEHHSAYSRSNLREILLNGIGCMNRNRVIATFDDHGFSITEDHRPKY